MPPINSHPTLRRWSAPAKLLRAMRQTAAEHWHAFRLMISDMLDVFALALLPLAV